MPTPPTELARIWLLKAHSDLHTAIQIGGLPDGHLDVGIYHCQQAAEKALKGFLVARETSFEKIHDLEKIITQAIELEPSFAGLKIEAESLTPYAFVYRYPNETAFLEPSRMEFDEAVRQAQVIYDFVLNLLPQEAKP